MKSNIFIVLLALTLLSISCNSTKPWVSKKFDSTPTVDTQKKTEFQLILIGDAGEPSATYTDSALLLLKNKIKGLDKSNSAVLFLGDNIYYNGLPDSTHPDRKEAERRITEQLKAVEDYEGRVIFIPGNHDWKRGRPEGMAYIKRQEEFIEQYLKKGDVFIPSNACPGPEVVALKDNLLLVLIDTQWWLHQHDKPTGDNNCTSGNDEEFITNLEEILLQHPDKHIVVAGHHPLFSNGFHGGYFPFHEHIFPLRVLNKKLYIPIPVIGSLYPTYRKYLGNIQDIPHPRYSLLKQELTKLFDKHQNVTYVAGHEHNLQYFESNNTAHIVSGSGSKHTYVRKGKKATFTYDSKGLAILNLRSNDSLESSFYSIHQFEKPVFSTKIPSQLKPKESHKPSSTLKDSTITIVPAEYFEASEFKKIVFGSHYRDIWTTPVTVPLLDFNSFKGGLTPIKRGGGMATKSLRLLSKEGKQYVIRSVEKFPDKALPEYLRGTVASDVSKDQISSAHPYAALVVPIMAEAIGVYHTNPQLFYVPDVPELGIYRAEFANRLVLFEERPHKSHKDNVSFGTPDKIVSSFDLIEKIQKSQKHKIDQRALVRARLFDILLGDWDRHDDQWRWAKFKYNDSTIYQPIPRDRDQVFYKVTGFLPNLINRKWAIRKFQNFNHGIRDIAGLGFNARYLDRSFLTEMTLTDWQEEASYIQQHLTDSIIDQIFDALPPSVQELHAEEIIAKLKSRRAELTTYATEHYKYISKTVNIVGTKKDEYFDVHRFNNDSLRVTLYKDKKMDEDPPLYQRTFYRSETKEIRLYGLGGKDVFHTRGEAKKGIKVRIIPGQGKDKLDHDTETPKRLTILYDKRDDEHEPKSKISGDGKLKKVLSQHSAVHRYNRKAFKYNLFAPLLDLGYNVDDGLYLGAGFLSIQHGFRQSPYAAKHLLTGKAATRSNAYQFKYKGEITKVIRNWSLGTNLEIKAPNFQTSFYGYGNEVSRSNDDEHYYWTRLNMINVEPYMKLIKKNHTLTISPQFHHYAPLESQNSFITNDLINSDLVNFDQKNFGNLHVAFHHLKVNDELLPQRGSEFKVSSTTYKEVSSTQQVFTKLAGELKLYIPISMLRQFTLATRIGGAYNIGRYGEFYLANSLNGLTNFRGVPRNRFTGDGVFYHNTELRIKLLNFKNYIFGGQLGLIGFFDYGKVIYQEDPSQFMHRSVGAGIYVTPYNMFVISSTYGFSDEDSQLNVNVGFYF